MRPPKSGLSLFSLTDSRFMSIMIYMNEYVIFLSATTWVVLSGGKAQATSIKSTPSVFKSRSRADQIARKVGGEVQPYYGQVGVSGSKTTVQAKQSPINRATPYRTI